MKIYIRDIQKLFQIGEDLSGLSAAIKTIRSTPNHEDLPSKYRAHPYKYSYHGVEYGIVVDVHIKGDLILLYQIKNGIMNCIRIGTHRDLKIGSSTEVSGALVYI